LEQAEQCVAEGVMHIHRQRKIVARLERNGRDTTRARELLASFETSLTLHVDDMERIKWELAQAHRR
jgi:hypothetical protein